MATLTRADDQVQVPERLPVVALRDLVFFPYVVLPILIGRRRSVAALEAAQEESGLVLLVAQKDPGVDDPVSTDLFRIGTVARVVQVTRLPDGTSRVVLEGLGRARVRRLTTTTESLRATVDLLVEREAEEPDASDGALERACEAVRALYEEYAQMHERIPEELSAVLAADGDRVRFAHLVSGHLILPSMEKQEVLEATNVCDQLDILREVLVRELEILRIEKKLDRQIQLQLGGKGSPFDLGTSGRGGAKEQSREDQEEWDEIGQQIREANLPPRAQTRAEKELNRLRRLNPVAPEAAVIRTHLDWIVSLPWTGRTEDNLDVRHAAEILEAEHFGLSEVKDRVLDHVAVLSLVGEMRGPILCLVGPPGVGKTSLGRSIAHALGREFVRVSLGGVRDEAEIRGHRRTYVGALPGRVIQGMRRSGTTNPVFLLDEIDKLARDFHGDPGAALLEVLDPEQNKSFTDHYLELEYDLSDVLFIATANTLQGVPEPLRDRMEVIRLPGYLDTEKREIAARFLWPRQAEQHGLKAGDVDLTPEAIHEVISHYTREAGVRELNRRLSRIARKLARSVADTAGHRADGLTPDAEERSSVVAASTQARVVAPDSLKELLGPPPYQPTDRDDDSDRVGIANGLAWTAVGGAVMDVEVAVVAGGGNLRLTGTLGDVMKESAQAAVTYARSRGALLGLDPHFHEKVDVHVHMPEGATPKDGPSAGITIAVALISALTDTPTRADVAMTGEITLRGRVIGVGGVKEKAVAALRNGMTHVVLPAANANDLETLPEEVLQNVTFELVKTMDEVLDAVLIRRPGDRSAPGHGADLSAPCPTDEYELKIRTVEYAGTIAKEGGPAPGTLPQVAFSGRSNVGKSSLINTVLQRTRSKIARVSATPGKTQALNFYLVNDHFFLVDLPGYGYARVPQSMRDSWGGLIEWYLSGSSDVRGVVHLVDARHKPTDHDLRMVEYLAEVGLPALVVLTKVDKLKRNERQKSIARAMESLELDEAQLLPFSSKTGEGRDLLLSALDDLVDASDASQASEAPETSEGSEVSEA